MKADGCLFCRIVDGEIPAEKIFENDKVLGFRDLYPQAKEHYLFISKSHSKNINEMNPEHMQDVFAAIKEFTENNALSNDGFRVVTNINGHGGQTIFHTHFHVLGGEQLASFGR